MRECEGDLLIGGMKLEHLHVDLEGEPPPGPGEKQLSGHLHLTPAQLEQIELNRPYRLVLPDGSAAQIVVSAIQQQRPDDVLVEFAPPTEPKAP